VRTALGLELAARGATLDREIQRVAGPSIWRISNVGLDDMFEIAAAREDLANALVVPDAARTMVAALAPLSQLRSSLPLIPLPGARRFERFDLPSASWTEASGVSTAGAYRLVASFLTTYLHVSPQEAKAGTGRLGTAQLVKHLAALDAGTPLVSYEKDSAILSVALGADLPGLYGRAVSLCSGELPVPVPVRRVLVYRNVPVDVASAITGLMSE
jgi:hypothetical protein